jgi:hypothetical protein
MASPLVYWAPVTKKALESETPRFGGAKSEAEKFTPLKVALENIPALCANHVIRLRRPACNHHSHDFQETSAVGNKITNLLARIVALEIRFDTPPSNVPEQRRRVDLIRCVAIMYSSFAPTLCSFLPSKLDGVRELLQLLSEKLGLPRPPDQVQTSRDAFRLLEDIQEAILDYQVCS